MARPYVLVQLSDLHIGGEWGTGDPAARLVAAVEAARRHDPDAVLVSGDLTDHGTDAEYGQVKALLAPLEAPVHVLPGNHDDRDALHRHFGVPGAGGALVQYTADLGPLVLVALDSTVPGSDAGEMGPERLAWLDETLGAEPDRPTLVAVHHPPVPTGIPEMDAIGLPAADQAAFARVVARHPQVRRIVSGHVHCVMAGESGGRPVLTVPSTYVQGEIDVATGALRITPDPAGIAVHALHDGTLLSHVQAVGER